MYVYIHLYMYVYVFIYTYIYIYIHIYDFMTARRPPFPAASCAPGAYPAAARRNAWAASRMPMDPAFSSVITEFQPIGCFKSCSNPETLNPKPETQNSKHQIRNPKPEIQNPEH